MSQPDMLAQSKGRFTFDIETDNLLADVTVIHCAAMIDLDTGAVHDFKPDQIEEFLVAYQAAKTLIGHNIIGYDLAVIDKLHGIVPHPTCEIIDTLNLARLVFSDIKASDFKLASPWKKFKLERDKWALDHEEPYPYTPPHEFPGQFVGLHSLEAWGYRMGTEKKGDYSKEMKAKGLDPWAAWNPEMHAYMIQDVVVNVQLYRYLMAQNPSPQSVRLEMRVQLLCAQMERNGWPFNKPAAERLYVELSAERETLAQSLRSLFPPWTVQLEDFVPKRANKTKGYLPGVPVERFETVEFNPASRDHIENRLRDKYDWKPTAFTPGGAATIDDDVLMALPFPEAKQLARFFMLQKRIGQLAEGDKAWLRYVTKEGKIHGRYSTNGCVTGRASHYNPNVGQVPSVGAEYGRDCRALFTVPKGWRQLGADQSGLELRGLGSFLYGFDRGAYIDIVLDGDIHWENSKAIWALADDLKYDPENLAHKKMRGHAKTIISTG